MSENIRALLVGATGLIGRTVIARSPDLRGLVLQALARREMKFPQGARIELVLAPSEEWPNVVQQLSPEALICALGTTRRKAGSNEARREVDHDLVLEFATAAKEAGVRNFVHVSSVGADRYSKNAYLQVKGETEHDLKALKFHRLDILRPGLLRGRRENDIRPLEALGQMVAPMADMFLSGGKSKFRSMRAPDLADAALQAASSKAGGQFIHEHDAIMRLAREFQRALAVAEEAE
ncbi:NAD(P)H-binding protein [Aurantiacibacter aquimixticola]|uniref:NAD-dependent epimerase/dehydratase family protein n=1 Tax=Aurantiacibacter aquimixticola TaxID=1958945 RepID=A0A419RR26_9SPHN|nr:NAD(P)H-binding protein [Aurantiacibacter aquimixticola]RJY08229.1 NAD-dependent epimerase/dehydratase family protein [Aurantiacibacter aquimixticola]